MRGAKRRGDGCLKLFEETMRFGPSLARLFQGLEFRSDPESALVLAFGYRENKINFLSLIVLISPFGCSEKKWENLLKKIKILSLKKGISQSQDRHYLETIRKCHCSGEV